MIDPALIDREKFMALVDRRGPDECWPWKGYADVHGYGRFSVTKTIVARAHRVAFLLEFGHWPEPFCLHSCDTPGCCNAAAHLREGTPAQNSADMQQKRRSTYGVRNTNARLTDQDVRDIRAAWQRGGTDKSKLARQYGISQDEHGPHHHRQELEPRPMSPMPDPTPERVVRWLRKVFLGGGRYHLGTCLGCGEFACPKVGPWYARRRDFAYCNDCIPELGEARKKAHRLDLARKP